MSSSTRTGGPTPSRKYNLGASQVSQDSDASNNAPINLNDDPIGISLKKREKDGKVQPGAVKEFGAKPKDVKVFALK